MKKNQKVKTLTSSFYPFPPTAEIIFRKSDVRKKGKTRGWEIMLSYSLHRGLTTGFVKGTPSSDIVESVAHLKKCAAQAAHPMLLPVIILSYDLSPRNDQKQRDAREWLRRLEHAVSMREEIEEKDGYVRPDGVMEVDAISRDLVECHSQVLWKAPRAYLGVVTEMEAAMARFWAKLPAERREGTAGGEVEELAKLHRCLLSRLDFYKVKLRGIENYQATTLERLNIQRDAVSPLDGHLSLLQLSSSFRSSRTASSQSKL